MATLGSPSSTDTLLATVNKDQFLAQSTGSLTNGLSKFKNKLINGQNAFLQIWGDSTSSTLSATGRWPDLFSQQVATNFPTHSVYLVNWDISGETAYNAATRISTGTTSAVCYIYNLSQAGVILQYAMGARWQAAILTNQVDGLIINHGINYFPGWDLSGQNGSQVMGAFIAGIEQFRAAQPDAPISVTIQLPNRDSGLLDNMPTYWRTVAYDYSLYVIDVYSVYAASGKPAAWYGSDGIHPSATGNAIWNNLVWQSFIDAPVTSVFINQPSFFIEKPNFLINGGFTTWTDPVSSAPDSWTNSGTVAYTKDTAAPADYQFGYSVKMAGSGAAQTLMRQDLGATFRAQLAGKYVTLAIKQKVSSGGAATVGRMGIGLGGTGGTTYNSISSTTVNGYRTDWNWYVMANLFVPTDVSLIRVSLYQDSASSPDTTHFAWYDHVWLGIGSRPFAARYT